MNEEEAIEILKIELENTKRANKCGLATKGEFDKQIQAIETILDLYKQEREKNKKTKDKIQLVLFKHRFTSPSNIDKLYKDVRDLLKEE